MISAGHGIYSSEDTETLLTLRSRLFYAVFGGIILYVLILINFEIFRESLALYAYRVAPSWQNAPAAVVMISGVGACLALFVPHHRSATGLFSHLSFAVLYVPLCAVYTLADGATSLVLTCGLALSLCYIAFGRQKVIYSNRRSNLDRLIFASFVGIATSVMVGLILSGDINFGFVSFGDVYKLRTVATAGGAPVAGRWVTISAYAASSYIIMYGMAKRSPYALVLGSANLYLLYNTFGFKLFLFFVPIVVMIYAYYYFRNAYCIILSLIFVLFLSKLLYVYSVPHLSEMMGYFNELIIRRYIYTPGYMSFAWYETFTDHPLVYMSNVFLINQFTTYPYDVNHSLIVARYIFGEDFNPNTNMMIYGFANFGYIGVVLYAILTYVFLATVDCVAYRTGSTYLRIGAMAPATLFLEADPLVVLVSFGLGVILIVAVITWILAVAASHKGANFPPQ